MAHRQAIAMEEQVAKLGRRNDEEVYQSELY